jgi:hypothetical protein
MVTPPEENPKLSWAEAGMSPATASQMARNRNRMGSTSGP